MKKNRIMALVLAVVMLSMVMVSCNKAEKVSVKATVSLVVDGETKFGPFEVTSEGTVDAAPTVLQAVNEALILNEIASENDGMGLTSVTLDGTVYAKGSDDVNIYSWYYTVNGAEPKAGRAGNNALVEGDEIVYIFEVRPIDPEDITPVNE